MDDTEDTGCWRRCGFFAAKGNPEIEAIGSLLLVIACVVTLIGYGIQMATTELSVDTKRGVPFCRG